ncbi:hypothetical protein CAOG_03589 [Capsaspora owczarzaki ATCC 30864]|uniref:C2H2-type domain-containing protein n=1 Tax=Capsaspora owczarzaki (strain ATCC 30864) TaxID=595528 RepID=A0A0D2WNI0_CAPO3|nr:hypothetical protein CAOG_03589 [Capsaspora owczarzaki ATCC 30864]KJE92670.1 hypothetical protein CAOG_003589 [Capsaspora owczarzaki ATCC 30864]|eukprot:XP_004363317.2 hypothetical protein CAOG_03589 [Capsaspora owczarzaki ATCC 30864]
MDGDIRLKRPLPDDDSAAATALNHGSAAAGLDAGGAAAMGTDAVVIVAAPAVKRHQPSADDDGDAGSSSAHGQRSDESHAKRTPYIEASGATAASSMPPPTDARLAFAAESKGSGSGSVDETDATTAATSATTTAMDKSTPSDASCPPPEGRAPDQVAASLIDQPLPPPPAATATAGRPTQTTPREPASHSWSSNREFANAIESLATWNRHLAHAAGMRWPLSDVQTGSIFYGHRRHGWSVTTEPPPSLHGPAVFDGRWRVTCGSGVSDVEARRRLQAKRRASRAHASSEPLLLATRPPAHILPPVKPPASKEADVKQSPSDSSEGSASTSISSSSGNQRADLHRIELPSVIVQESGHILGTDTSINTTHHHQHPLDFANKIPITLQQRMQLASLVGTAHTLRYMTLSHAGAEQTPYDPSWTGAESQELIRLLCALPLRRPTDRELSHMSPLQRERPYCCKVCGKLYKNPNGLQHHYAHWDHGPTDQAIVTALRCFTAKPRNKDDVQIACATCLRGFDSETKPLCCSSCSLCYHPACAYVAVTAVAEASSYPWECLHCKTCEVCGTAIEHHPSVVCDKCDRTAHAACRRNAGDTQACRYCQK